MKKVTFILKLNALLIAFCMVVLSVNNVFAQSKKNEYYGEKLEKKADKFNYVFHEQGEMYFLYNKNNSLMIYESSFTTKTNYQLNIGKIIQFPDRAKVDSLVFKHIAPLYKNYKSKYSDKISSFDINIYSKTDGAVCELSFSLNRDANIPLKTIEKLEKEILSLGVRMEFDPNDYHIKDAIWVSLPLMYSVGGMKDNVNKKNKEK